MFTNIEICKVKSVLEYVYSGRDLHMKISGESENSIYRVKPDTYTICRVLTTGTYENGEFVKTGEKLVNPEIQLDTFMKYVLEEMTEAETFQIQACNALNSLNKRI